VTTTGPLIDREALAALRREPSPWSAKGLPLAHKTASIEGLTAGHPRLDRAGFTFPLMTLLESELANDISVLADFCAVRGVDLAPHGKTTMAPQLFARQLDAGAWGISAATIDQLMVNRRFGVRRVLLANELVDAPALRWVLGELERDPGFEFLFYLDSDAGVQTAAEALRAAGPSRGLRALVEIGIPGGRTGCRSVAEALAVARAASAVEGLEIAGIAGYEGLFGYHGAPGAVERVRAYLSGLREGLSAFVAAGILPSTGAAIMSAAGSHYFDLVIDELHDAWPAAERPHVIIRPGSYIAHADIPEDDDDPLRRAGFDGHLRPAAVIWGRVLSRPEVGQAFASAGRRDLSWDVSLPTVRWVWRQGADRPFRAAGVQVTQLNDQHAFMALEPGVELGPGDLVGFGTTHPCTTFDRWQVIPILDDDFAVIDAVRTFF
jgi:D-serine deaminase-like pyridoxal phosphate-dependent protein